MHRIGRDQRHPRLHRGLPQSALNDRLGFRQLRLGVDAAHFVLRHFEGCGAQAKHSCDRHRVGQIELTLAIVVADCVENRKRPFAVEGHQPAIAKRDGALLFGGVGVLDNGEKLRALRHQPAVARGIRGFEAQHRHGHAVGQRLPELRKRLRPDQRRVAKMIRISSAPCSMAARAASTACAVPRRSR